ncbi:hypothetical protein T552_03170 [Pneumocystis carinii B80]|uniref:Sister chromatid cohesion protein n=1 Tax=Pneumocystis carinii (strain B80) TaxID=1408658 RepID=A0A0W4ZBS9_PNEC8|nr:hypothetical protein T552_03170 [Pneumocystis carinii B80]KTW25896.1 hypothetical protein T552_03170 [Pneumocystis carinii B80]
MARLGFKETLISKGGGRFSVNELLKRLRVLQSELAEHDQEQIERESLNGIIVELINEGLLNHKDKGVRAYTACCLADILRLCAPDAPYTPSQLNNIFELFVGQLKNLFSSELPYYAQSFYLLESLSQVKSVVLIADLSNGHSLTMELFRMFFEMVTPEQPRNVVIAMVDILAQLIDEFATLPPKVIDIMLSQFTVASSKKNHPFGMKTERPPAYIMAKQLFNICAERLQRYVCQHFTDVVFEANRSIERDPQVELDKVVLEEVEKVHNLVYELYIASPSVLENIMPQLEQELMVENVALRLLSTSTISEMFSIKEQKVDFVKEYPSLWKSWVSRGNDKNSSIRIRWLEGLFNVLINFGYSPEAMAVAIEGILSKHVDIDEKVRMTVCKMIGSLDYKIVSERIPSNILEALSDRCKDRKHMVRVEAMHCLGKLYYMAYNDILKNSNPTTEWFLSIPSRILHTIYINDKEINALLEFVLYQYILDYTEMDDFKRTERMLFTFKNLDGRAKHAFLSLGRNQPKYAKIAEYYLSICEKYNGGVITDNEKKALSALKDAITRLKSLYGDSSKAELDFEKFSRLNDRRLYKLLGDCMNLMSDYKQIQKSQKEFFKRIEQSSTLVETFKILVLKISPMLYNKSVISPIIEYARSNKNMLADTACELLKEISLVQPSVYKAHIEEILSLIKEHDIKSNISYVDTLKVYAQFTISFPQDITIDPKLLKALTSFALKGTPAESKQAVFILLHSMNKEKFTPDLIKKIFDGLTVGSEYFLTRLSALSQFVLYAPEEMEPRADQYTSFFIKEVLLVNLISEDSSEEDWVENNVLENECKAKILALKTLVNRLRANVNADGIQELAKPVFRLLASILTNMGEISKERNTPARFQSHIRLAAGRLFLKLSSYSVFEEMISVEDFYKMALLVQDPCFQVRYNFVKKLMKGLNLNKLTARYYVPIFLMAHEPEEEFKQEVSKWIKSCISAYRAREIFTIEYAIVRFIHFLSHHPDFSTDSDDLIDFAKYINFYLELVATSDCLSLLFHLVQRIKQVYDLISPENSDRLYVLSDLSQALIRIVAESNSWTMQIYPKKLKLPIELYAPLTNAKVATEITQRNYIDKDIEEQLLSLTKSLKLIRKRKSIGEKQIEPIKRRFSKNTIKNQRKKKLENTSVPLRRSRRVLQAVNYVENGDEDDDEMIEEINDHESDESDAQLDSLDTDSSLSP